MYTVLLLTAVSYDYSRLPTALRNHRVPGLPTALELGRSAEGLAERGRGFAKKCICVYVYVYTYMLCTFSHIHVIVCIRIRIHIHIHTHTHIHIHVHTYVCTYVGVGLDSCVLQTRPAFQSEPYFRNPHDSNERTIH